jgi:hypothetical protein
MPDTSPTYRSMMIVDIERSAGRGDVALNGNREVLIAALREAFTESGIDWAACHRKDTGDGMEVVSPPDLPKARLIHPLVHTLAIRLRSHNQTAGPLGRIRVRIAVHAGDVHLTDGQVVGGSLEHLARLAEAQPLRQALASAPESVTVALAVSEHIHQEVVRHRYPGIDPDAYHLVTFTVKETTATAWLHLPGCVLLPTADSAPPTAEATADTEATGNGETWHFPAAQSVNVATGHARVRDQIGRIGTRIDHAAGPVTVGSAPEPEDLRRQLADLRREVAAYRRAGLLDEGTFADAEMELHTADAHAAGSDPDSRGALVRALKKLKAVVDHVADLAAKVAAVIAAVRGR